MSHSKNRSPYLEASDRLAVNIERLSIEELEQYVKSIERVILALFKASLKKLEMSSFAMANLDRLIKKLRWRLEDSLTLIEDRKAEAAAETAAEAIEPPPKGAGAAFKPPF